MNNKNKILAGCLALLLVLSVGYALFSETITINGTATAKGSFDISYACEMVTTDDGSGLYTIGGTGTCDTTSGIIKTTSTLNKPTDVVVYKVTLTNSGTIAAKLTTVTTPNKYAFSTFNTLTAGDAMYYDASTALAGYFSYLPAGGTAAADGVFSESDIEGLELTIGPQENLLFYVVHVYGDIDNQPVLPTNGATLNYNVSLGFEQVAAQ